MINATREKIVRTLRDDSDLFTDVGGRIYPSQLATLKDPKYPCITVGFSGGNPDNDNPDLASGSIIIQYYSTKSYQEGWDLHKKAKAVLDFAVLQDPEVNIRMTEESLPWERWDTDARVYILTNHWNVFMIGT